DRRRVGTVTSCDLGSELVADPLPRGLRGPGQDLPAGGVAPDREPEEVEPLGQVHDLCLVLVERQSSWSEPSGQPCLDRQGFLTRVAHDHEVVRVTDHGGGAGTIPSAWNFLVRECLRCPVASSIPCMAMFNSSGEMMPPCGVPAS